MDILCDILMGFGIEDHGRLVQEAIFRLSPEEWIEGSQAHRGKEGFQEQRRVYSTSQSQEHDAFWEVKVLWYD